MRKNTLNLKKTMIAAAAAAVGVGTIGIGANWDHVTSVVGNQFSATVTDTPPDEIGGALLVATGEAMDHTFDTTQFNQTAGATWTVTNRGTGAAQFSATFAATGEISQTLAENLDVQYAVTNADGEVVRWVPAGTIAAPLEYTRAVGTASEIGGLESHEIQVRVVLEDPTLLEGEPETVLNVTADFDISYMTSSVEP